MTITIDIKTPILPAEMEVFEDQLKYLCLKHGIAADIDNTETGNTTVARPALTILDAKKYKIWIEGMGSKGRQVKENLREYKTLWDIPYTYLPKFVFNSGFETASSRLPSDGSNVNVNDMEAQKIPIVWINLPMEE